MPGMLKELKSNYPLIFSIRKNNFDKIASMLKNITTLDTEFKKTG